jgi:hypothetical protein
MIRIEVFYDRHIDRWTVRVQRIGTIITIERTAEEAEKRGRVEARRMAKDTGKSVELILKGMDGKIRPGKRGRSTYGHDPKRHAG